MPNIKSQKDRVVQAKKEALHNKVVKSNLKNSGQEGKRCHRQQCC